ncbi:fibrinogen alpha chain isoform X2 [Corythoichthys intestinalis]|uniref:fibrinogen alpha chain isoform X2 n=1 Tax=Corythoichthys intestinalis TaxID=161448 RepID=UPI0025A5C670|nr:fibrinogen alpha chain isoform X2 [Corythoichthys intestinalis]
MAGDSPTYFLVNDAVLPGWTFRRVPVASGKCPSGCRLQAALSQTDSDTAAKIYEVCNKARTSESSLENVMAKVADVYRRHRKVLVIRHVSELKLVQDGAQLARKLTSLRQRSLRLQRRLKQLNERVRQQVEELWRAEVDVDMKLRACKGSCRTALALGVDHHNYHTLLADVSETYSRRKKKAPQDIPQITVRSLEEFALPSEAYKWIPTVQKELLTQFEDIPKNQIFVENGDS